MPWQLEAINDKNENNSMFDKDFWSEILETVASQKWRSLMTAFGVFWGIFMLVMLIGAGMGLNNGLVGKFMLLPTNSVFLIPQETSMPYEGNGQGRKWSISLEDTLKFRQAFPKEIGNMTLLDYVDEGALKVINHGDKMGSYKVVGVTPTYLRNIPQKLVAGRFINDIDLREARKVCVIGTDVQKNFFPNIQPVGRTMAVDGITYMIVGVVKNTNKMVNLQLDPDYGIQLPLTTEMQVYGKGNQVQQIVITLHDEYPAMEYQERLELFIKGLHKVHPKDPSALVTFNLANILNQYKYLFIGLNILIWIVGLGTLLAGLIGISNIMMVTVKERTQEIGVRRALGAMPEVIIKQIMCESLVLTFSAGIFGLAMGTFALSALRNAMPDDGASVFTNPYVPFVPAVAALVILVMGGLFAGWLPAKRALAIKAIEALREE
jgi:putative ABC transport system permease protein